MSHISKPVDWEVYSIPPIQPVQYYSILKKQREFSQLIKKYDAQVFKHGYLHYCGIVPKYLHSSLNNRYEIVIVFLNEVPTTSFIGFRVKVSKETFTYESKSLLLFLKNSEKAILYSMNDNCIHVHCGTNAWELFYLLYDDYLRKYVLTIIGTQFFYHFVYSYCIEKEKQVLKWLYKGSKVIRISKTSIYYKIHRKRKISVTDLVHMTLNMPKRKKYMLSHFNSKESLLHSNLENGNFYTASGNKINISKLMLKKYKKQDIVVEKYSQKTILSNITHKRKFVEIDTNQKSKLDTSSKHFKTSESYSTENQWEQYKKFKSYSIQNYSNILFMNTLVPSLLKNGNSSCSSNLYSDVNLPFLTPSDSMKKDEMEYPKVVQETCTLSDHKKKDTCESPIKKPSLYESKLITYSGCVIPKALSSHSTFPNNDHESHSCTNNSNSTESCDINFSDFSTNIKGVNNDGSMSEDVNFSTAAGKIINVSSAAMLKAYKFCEKEQTLPERTISDVKQKVPEKIASNIGKHEVPEKNNFFGSKREIITSVIKKDENMPEKLSAAHSSKTESLKFSNFNNDEDVTFSTAAGKTISVSNNAVEAAQKLICNVGDKDKMLSHNENIPIQKNRFYKNEISKNGCTSKVDDVDMDNTLVERFFEDVQFDEKELEFTETNIKKDNINIISESKNDKSLPTRKQRKSLGGRRSMRYCSDKL